jgi:hypothetical protein
LRDGFHRLLKEDSRLSQLRAGALNVAQELSWDEPVTEMERIYAVAAKSKGQRSKGQEQSAKGEKQGADRKELLLPSLLAHRP